MVLVMLGAFAYAQERKGEPLILDRVVFGYPNRTQRSAFTPNGDGCVDQGRVIFRITRSDRGDVEIVSPEGLLVRTLDAGRELPSYTFFEFFWDGRGDYGQIVPEGRYKLRVRLYEQDRSLIPGGGLVLHEARRRESCGPRRPGTAG